MIMYRFLRYVFVLLDNRNHLIVIGYRVHTNIVEICHMYLMYRNVTIIWYCNLVVIFLLAIQSNLTIFKVGWNFHCYMFFSCIFVRVIRIDNKTIKSEMT